MSVMPAVLGLRASAAPARAATPTVDAPGATLSLADLTRGQSGVVVGVQDVHDPAIARRLTDLGFVAGTEVRMLRRAPLADPVVFRVAGYDIALRRAQARCIKVDPAP